MPRSRWHLFLLRGLLPLILLVAQALALSHAVEHVFEAHDDGVAHVCLVCAPVQALASATALPVVPGVDAGTALSGAVADAGRTVLPQPPCRQGAPPRA